MATAFAQQLRQIAANSTNELDLKARREAHAGSLIFERDVAVNQDWETLYQVCIEGFQELCLLDRRFKDFERNLFAYHSKDQDREQLNKSQNESLDSVIEQCLEALGSRLALRPGIKALEWLVRRFRVHAYNAGALLLTALPYHETSLFQGVLAIVPTAKIVDEWKFLRPYQQRPSILPRHSIVYSATTNDGFFSALNRHALEVGRNGSSTPVFLRFWSSIVVEAIAARLKQAKSGRKEIQTQRTEDIFFKILPIVSDGLGIDNSPDMTIACFAITLVIASTGMLEDKTLDALIQAVAVTLSYPSTDINQALVCLAILASQKEGSALPGRVVNIITGLDDPITRLQNAKRQYSIANLIRGLVQGALKSLKQKDTKLRLSFLEQMLKAGPTLCDETDLIQFLVAVVSQIQRLESQDPTASFVRFELRRILQDLYDSSEFAKIFSQMATLCQQQGIELDIVLEAIVPAIEVGERPVELMEEGLPTNEVDKLQSLVAALPDSFKADEIFLTTRQSPTFTTLLEILRLCLEDQEGIAKFSTLAVWEDGLTNPSAFFSFLLRVACGCFTHTIRAFAISILAANVRQRSAAVSQTILPYASVMLSDSAVAVRRQAANLILSIEKTALTGPSQNSDHSGSLHLYADNNTGTGAEIEPAHLVQVLQQVYLPRLEECASDREQIQLVLQQALGVEPTQHQPPSSHSRVEIKKSLRVGLMDCLAYHACATPLLSVKMGLVCLLEGVGKVGSTTKNERLRPILDDWLALTAEEALLRAQAEQFQPEALDAAVAQLITAKDHTTLAEVVKAVEERKLHPRPKMITALFDRLTNTWTTMKAERQQTLSTVLLNLSFSEITTLARGARSVLKNAPLSTSALQALFEESVADTESKDRDSSPSKKRKINHPNGEGARGQAHTTLSRDLPRIVLALEITDASKPESRPELLGNLFHVLILLRRLKASMQSESPYALGLCINCLLAIVDQANKSRKSQLDVSSIRADIVIECLRHAESPQVQSNALMLAASLAELAPDQVIHHIMPVFTFMGHNMMSLDDGHSVNVINQAIDRIVPPLVGKLKQQDESSLIRSTTALLTSFVTAFDHIPHHRRVKLYQRLLRRLGPEDFGFALLAMLAMPKSSTGSREDFLVGMMSEFSPLEQLITYFKLISLIADIYADKPHNAESLLHIDGSAGPTERLEKSLGLFVLAERLLKSKYLRSQLSKLERSHSESRSVVQDELKTCLHQILDTTQTVKAYGEDMKNASRRCMTALLELLSLSQLIEILPDLLRGMEQDNENLKPDALNVLAAQMRGKVPNDRGTSAAALGYLSDLGDMLKFTTSDTLRAAAVGCVDNIVDKYGRKDSEPVIKIATVLAGEEGMAASNAIVQQRSTLTLASVFDILGQAAVPIIPETMENTLAVLAGSIEQEKENPRLHDAAFALVSAIASNVPFMISEDHLDRTLVLAAEAAFSDLPKSCGDQRKDTLQQVARKVDFNALIDSLRRTWEQIVENDIDAILPALDMCMQAIDHHSKSAVIKAADVIAAFIIQILDLRRVQFTNRDEESYSDDEVAQVESKVNDLALKFIYKLNDGVFRPVFESWVDWGIKCHDLPANDSLARSRVLRQTSLFNLLIHFFSTLKSIVTSYAAYIISPANTILQTFSDAATNRFKAADLVVADQLLLYTTLLTLLRHSFLHDADSFFTSPSHFSSLSTNLLAQLKLAAHKPFRPLISSRIIPCIVAFATATQDTPAHHMTLNHYLAQLRHDESSHVRLAGIRTHIAITEEEEVGDEWVNNVVSGTASATLIDADGGSGKPGASGGGSGETMIYVNEMLEDDDEDVEREVRRWVRMVREKVGEDVFEF
jgi:U3 small nucleolar RNA-associated protein 10